MTDTSLLTSALQIKVNGHVLTTAEENQLVAVTVERAWSTVDRIELRFDDRRDDAPDFRVGDSISAEMVTAENQTGQVFSGEITAKSVQWSFGTEVVVYEGYDKRHRLVRGITPAAYKKANFSDVVSSIASNAGLRFDVPQSLRKTTHEDLMFASSDFATLQQIAHLTGTQWTVTDDKITFVETVTGAADLTLDSETLIDIDIRFTPIERADEIEVRGWDARRKQAIVGQATHKSSTSKHQPPTAIGADKALPNPGKPKAMSWAAGPTSQAEADDMAAGIDRRLTDTEIVGRGSTRGHPAIAPGAKLEIENVSPRINGTYAVMSATHVYGAEWGSLVTHFRIGPTDSSLANMLDDGAVQPTGRLTNGVSVGVVTNIEDTEHPGAVRLKLPFISDDLETGWARVMSFGGGTNRGTVFMPEVDDEVLVAFEHGDLNRPYVIGSVWNDAGTVLDTVIDGKKVDERRIVSKLGNRIRFIDKETGDDFSGFAVEVDDAKTKLFFGYNKTELVTTDRPLELKNGKASILLDKDEITITANKITLKSPTGDVILDSKTIKMNAKQKLSAEAPDITIKSSGMATLQAGGIMTVKGSMVKVN